MTWLTPLVGAIVLASAIPPLLALYFLRLRRARRPIPSTLLWKRATEDIRANAPFQRLRANLLLLLQLLVLILLAIALMQPQVDAGRRHGGKTVILIDNSASMNATDAGEDETRLEEAKRRARDRVEELHGGGLFGGMPGEVMVIAFNSTAEVRTPFTDSRPQALAAIDGIEPSDAVSELGPALELARAYATTINPEETDRSMVEPATLELYSDGRIQDLDEHVLQGNERMEYHVVGTADSRNVTVFSLAADRPYDAPGKVQVFTVLYNANPEPVEADVQLSVDGGVRSITPKPVVIPAATVNAEGGWTPGRKQISFTPFDQLRDAVIEVEVLMEDDLPLDNVAALVVPPARSLDVAVVGRHSYETVELLRSMSLERLELLDVATFLEMAEQGETDQFDVVVLSNVQLDSLPPGRYLSFGPTPPIEGLEEFGSMGRGGVVSRSRDEHPILRYVNLDVLYVFNYHKIAPGPVGQPIVETGSGPLIMEIDRGNIQMVHVAFDPLESNWPPERSWANFVPNVIEYLGTLDDAVATAGGRPGDALTARLPADATNVRLRLPGGDELDLTPVDPVNFAWGPARRVGLYELTWDHGEDATDRRVFAINLFDDEEGRIQSVDTIALSVDEVTGDRGERGNRWTGLWPWLLGIVLAMLMLEWWLWQRRAGSG